MATLISKKNGKVATLLNPGEKGKKFAAELRNNKRYTNDARYIKQHGLSDTERAYRSGYLAARQDSAKCYNAQHGIKQSKKSRKNTTQVIMITDAKVQ